MLWRGYIPLLRPNPPQCSGASHLPHLDRVLQPINIPSVFQNREIISWRPYWVNCARCLLCWYGILFSFQPKKACEEGCSWKFWVKIKCTILFLQKLCVSSLCDEYMWHVWINISSFCYEDTRDMREVDDWTDLEQINNNLFGSGHRSICLTCCLTQNKSCNQKVSEHC